MRTQISGFSLSSIITLMLGLSGCIQTETYRLKTDPGKTLARYHVTYAGQPIQIRLNLPSAQVSEETINLLVHYKENDVRVGIGSESRYRISNFQIHRNKPKPELELTLRFDDVMLPLHQPSKVQAFETQSIWKSVGKLLVESEKGASVCNASLVGPDLIVTAAHCLHIQRDCKNVSFVLSNPTTTVRSCVQVEHLDKDVDQVLLRLNEPIHDDSAILEVLRTPASFAPQMQTFVASDVSKWVAEPRRWIMHSLKKKMTSCPVVQRFDYSNVAPTEPGGNDDVIFSSYEVACSIEKGQSGSPVLDNDGKLIGVLASKNMQLDQELAYFSPISPAIVEHIERDSSSR